MHPENSRLKVVIHIHNSHSGPERKQEQGHIYQTATSHDSNEARINTNYMKRELMGT